MENLSKNTCFVPKVLYICNINFSKRRNEKTTTPPLDKV